MSYERKKGYAWPASAISETEMAVLVDVRAETGKPISVLLKEAVQKAYGGCSSFVPEKEEHSVLITRGLFAGEKGVIEKISRDGKSIKLEGRGWYSADILKEVKA
jgi:transcription antitermination factor NusG